MSTQTAVLLGKQDINEIISKTIKTDFHIVSYELKSGSNLLLGYLSEQLHLHVKILVDTKERNLRYFLKCLPTNDEAMKQYIVELTFFYKEYKMLELFEKFEDGDSEETKWRPKLFILKPEVFVFENLNDSGFYMPRQDSVLEIKAVKESLLAIARFHAGTFIYEAKKSNILGRSYSVWEDYEDALKEPPAGKLWRDIGALVVKDFLKNFSRFKGIENFNSIVDEMIDKLYEEVLAIMKPSKKYRNTIIHRDLWANNIMIRKYDKRALIIDFQTTLYAPPMLDVCSFMYFNTSKGFRDKHTLDMIQFYYSSLQDCLNSGGENIEDIIPKSSLMVAYDDSILFGLTQAGLILPLTAFGPRVASELFADSKQITSPIRSRKILEYARFDDIYKTRIIEVCDELFERYCCINENE